MKRRISPHTVLIAAVLGSAAIFGSMIGNLGGPTLDTSDAQLGPLVTTAASATPQPTRAPTSPTAQIMPPTRAPNSPTVQIMLPTATLPTATLPITISGEPTPAASPTPQPQPTPGIALIDYAVQPGDIVFVLAERFNTTPEEIVALNPGINPESLTVGEILRLPAPIEEQ